MWPPTQNAETRRPAGGDTGAEADETAEIDDEDEDEDEVDVSEVDDEDGAAVRS